MLRCRRSFVAMRTRLSSLRRPRSPQFLNAPLPSQISPTMEPCEAEEQGSDRPAPTAGDVSGELFAAVPSHSTPAPPSRGSAFCKRGSRERQAHAGGVRKCQTCVEELPGSLSHFSGALHPVLAAVEQFVRRDETMFVT
jgi:hypothetical protein